jgi:hypothetical protein
MGRKDGKSDAHAGAIPGMELCRAQPRLLRTRAEANYCHREDFNEICMFDGRVRIACARRLSSRGSDLCADEAWRRRAITVDGALVGVTA